VRAGRGRLGRGAALCASPAFCLEPELIVPKGGQRRSPEEWEAVRAAAEAAMRRGGGRSAVVMVHEPGERWEAHGGLAATTRGLQCSGDDAGITV